MKTKVLEIRDRSTFFAVLAVDLNPDQNDFTGEPEAKGAVRYHLRRVGHPCNGRPNIGITHITAKGMFCNDPYYWDGRTYPVAHKYIIEHWDELWDGDVIDVEFILGETTTKKISERFENADGTASFTGL